jgi:hypothetical protein
VTCDGLDANAEQVNRGIAWVNRKYAKDHNLYVLQTDAKVAGRGLWSEPSPMPPWEWRQSYCMQPFDRYAMPDFSRVEQYMAVADKLVLLAKKEELAECSRILAMILAHYKMKYGELPQDDGMFMADLGELSEQQVELVIEGMENACGSVGKRDSGAG